MSMPMLAVSPTEEETSPALRLAGEAAPVPALDPSLAFDIRPNPPPGLSNLPRAFVRGGMLFANDGATLPAACVVCGDSVGLCTLPTPRGLVRFSLCREHLVAAASLSLVGLGICGAAAFLVLRGGGMSTLAFAALLCAIGGGLVAWAVPVWTWRRRGEARRLMRVHADVLGTIERSGR